MSDIIIAITILTYPAALFIQENNLRILILDVIDFIIFIMLKIHGVEMQMAFVLFTASIILNIIICNIKTNINAGDCQNKKTGRIYSIIVYLLNISAIILFALLIVKTPLLIDTGRFKFFDQTIIVVLLATLFFYSGYSFLKEIGTEND